MKNFFVTILFLLLCAKTNAQTSNFTITNNSGTYTLSCIQTSITLTASTNIVPPYSFNWAGPSFSQTTPSVTLSQAGSYTVTLLDSSNVIIGIHYITINANTLTPSSVVSPASQTITCGSASLASISTYTAASISHTYTSPYGASVSFSGSNGAAYSPLGPGTYTHYSQDITNGCLSSSTFTLVSNSGFPTFSITSPQNFSLGCNSSSVAIISLTYGNTQPSGGPVSYTFVPASGLNQISSGILSATATYTLSSPGIYYAVIKDNISFCMTKIPVTIISNTTAPNVEVTVPSQILTCDTSELVLKGNSFTPDVSYLWTYTGIPGSSIGHSLTVSTNSSAPTSTIVNVYTLSVIDNNNSCKSTTIIPIYQNTFKPIVSVSTSSTYTLSCQIPSIVLTNQSITGIPQPSIFSSNQPIVGFLWEGPSPQLPANTVSTYTAYLAGAYTLTVKDLNNGCIESTQVTLYGGCSMVNVKSNSSIDFNLYVFPNPGSGLYTITSDNIDLSADIEVYNSIGVLIKKQTFENGDTVLDLNSETEGIYFIYFKHDKKMINVKKIIKQ